MSTLTTTQLSTLPRVNLLPPEIAEQRRFRRLQVGLAAGVLASVGIVGALYVSALGDVSSAEDDLAAQKAQTQTLQSQMTEYANVPAVMAAVDAAELQRSKAMSQEVRWSFYLNDLSLRIPNKIWLTKLTVQQNVDGDATSPTGATAATATTPGAQAEYPEAGLGTVSFEGTAYRHGDVATWLEMLAHQQGWSQAYFTEAAEDEGLLGPNGDEVVNFKSQVTITEDALSKRYVQKAGS